MRRTAGLTVFVIVVAQMAAAFPPLEVFVTTNGTGAGYPSWAEATNSIQGAIDIISDSPASTVWVSNGVYATGGVINYPAGTVLTNRVMINKAITVRSANNDPAHTIIQGAWDHATTTGPAAVRCVYMVDGSSLIGFTITKGATLDTGDDNEGGGIWGASANTVVSNCVIVGNSAKGSGGGAYRGTLYDCTLALNSAGYAYWWRGGGGAMGSTLYGCVVSNNSSGIGIGAFWCRMYDCTVVNNTLGSGGVALSTLTNCTLIGNQIGAFYNSTLYDCRLFYNTGNYGAGASLQCKLYGCTLIGNAASQGGGGASDRCLLYDCLLLTNSAQFGGAVSSFCILSNCTLIGNSNIQGYWWDHGGGADDNCSLYNCLLAHNTSSGKGGGACNCNLYNCSVVSNTATVEGGGAWGGNLLNSIVYFNTAPAGENI